MQCIQCKQSFTISEKDVAFYQKVNVPHPTHCPDCRQQRRLAFRNERTLYTRTCDLCKKGIVSIYPEKTPFPVYCPTCWWSDSWEATQYGIDYNPGVPFFDQFKELQSNVPRISILSITSENSDYTNNAADNKNCYLLFAAENCEDCYYGRLVQTCKTVVDCDNIYDSEKCYGSVDCRNCYSTLFSERCLGSNDVLFGYNLSGCSNCILCTNLRNKEYHIENKSVSKEEFEAKKKEILSSRESLRAAQNTFDELKKRACVKFAEVIKCENSSGDYLFNCHDTTRSFDATNAKDCAYVNDALDPVDFYDGNNIYYKPELCYEIMGTIQCYNSMFNTYVFYGSNLLYSDSCHNTNDVIGCIGLRKKQYCILNKEYSQEEFEKLKNDIVERLRQEKIYGEFFPVSLSPFAYNEVHAMTYYPLTREQVEAKGWRWADVVPYTVGIETLKPENVPPSLAQTHDDITKEVLACTHCGRNYRITGQELSLYKMFNLPIPLLAPECRLLERQTKRNPRKLYSRKCTCAGKTSENSLYANIASHSHGEAHCEAGIETAYAPERPEIVYCEDCYLTEIT
ncbi:zinc-ribbon domain containing protein [Candidatus Uhrbacteria bacterium]|nr:zinc-ribbon domain containing protein [Candidatus Uhrbacteria bacterium]